MEYTYSYITSETKKKKTNEKYLIFYSLYYGKYKFIYVHQKFFHLDRTWFRNHGFDCSKSVLHRLQSRFQVLETSKNNHQGRALCFVKNALHTILTTTKI